jgi:hypothetical protein
VTGLTAGYGALAVVGFQEALLHESEPGPAPGDHLGGLVPDADRDEDATDSEQA